MPSHTNPMTASTRIWFVIAPILCALIPLVCVPLAEWIAVAPHGTRVFLWLVGIFVIPGLVAVPAFLAALIGLAFRRARRYSAAVALCSAVYLLTFML